MVFRFHVDASVTGKLVVGEVSESGAHLKVLANGREIQDVDLPKGTRNKVVSFALPAGDVELTIQNTGEDWAKIEGFTIPGIAPAVRGAALGEIDWSILRITGDVGSHANVSGLSLADGDYDVTSIDLESGTTSVSILNVKGFAIPQMTLTSPDVVLVFRRK
jgi:hypothetical protein